MTHPDALPHCPICAHPAEWHDVVDLNKCCEEPRGQFLPLSGTPVYYALCGQCGHCFCPEMCAWDASTMAERIYNADYVRVDPDYVEVRPRGNAVALQRMFPRPRDIRHLDYGGGNGSLSSRLRAAGWASASCDPFAPGAADARPDGPFDLVTAFEVFEHAQDPAELMRGILALLRNDGLLIFSTQLSDQHVARHRRLDWWYASPRNGHISLFTRRSLATLARTSGLTLASFSPGLHMMYRDRLPPWAQHFVRQPPG